jgi:uncharacterized sodium:solute symporter family permease YidK
VQRYLSGSSLTQSRLSLLFNAFLKVPMQFLILLTGVLVFVFYHFHPPPLLWNRVELAKLERLAPADELNQVKARFDAAQAARRAAAETYAHTRDAADAESYRRANASLDEVRRQAIKLLEDAEPAPAAPSKLVGWLMRILGIKAGGYSDTNYIFPTYILTHLPRGLAGLVIAVIFAAAMSTLSGEFNSLATATMVDFYKRFVRTSGSDAHDLLVSRLLTAFWGGFACLIALQAGRLGSAIEVVNRFGSYFYGSILGVFGLAVLTRRASAAGAFWGLLAGMATVWLIATFTAVHFLWYNVVGAVTVFVVGMLLTSWRPRQAAGA